MKKYEFERVVGAIYDNAPLDNPFLAAMPEMLSAEEYRQSVQSLPPMPSRLSALSAEERRQQMPILSSLFVPMGYMYRIFDTLYRAITSTYMTRTEVEGIRQINALFCENGLYQYATQADSGSIFGVPGIGKTSAIRRSLALIPQVIEHTEYRGHPFFCKQVLYLHIEGPSDCSIKTLAMNLTAALDKAIGSDYLNVLTSLRSAAASAIATQVKVLCINHYVGLILVDEIQNAVITARKNRQIKPLIKFLVELTNDTCTSIYFVGTPIAEELFISQEHLKRRTRGIRLLPLKPDGAYRDFIEKLWPYQLTVEQASLTDKLANKLYDYSGGIPAYIVKIFQESQVQALLTGRSYIDAKIMQQAIDILAIKVPETYSGGTYLSDLEIPDFSEGDTVDDSEPETVTVPQEDNSETEEVPRLYANKRGRKVTQRDEADLLTAFKMGGDLRQKMISLGLLEVIPPC